MSYPLVNGIKINYKYSGIAAAVIILAVTGVYCMKRSIHPVYLSDISPITSSQGWGQLQKDHSVDGGELRGNGFYFKKGLGTHANSSIEYALDGRYHYLEGSVAMDEEARQQNKIEASIYADDKLIYKSGIITGWEDPRYFYLNISGAKVLKLVIGDGNDGINFDHADWLEIRVLP